MPERITRDGRPAVLRAAHFYTPPPGRAAAAWQGLPSAERVIAWYEHTQQRRLPRPSAMLLGSRLYARIDAGRWVADCPCRSAQIVSPDDPRMFCVECLSGWHQLSFPVDVAAAEQAVADLPAHERFWWHPEDGRAWNRPAGPPTEKRASARHGGSAPQEV